MTRLARQLSADLFSALAVLGLVFLSFAHSPVALSSPGAGEMAGIAASDYCVGHGTIPIHKAAAGCDACRIGSGVDLPSPPPGLPASQALETMCLPIPDGDLPSAHSGHGLGPRGPPPLA